MTLDHVADRSRRFLGSLLVVTAAVFTVLCCYASAAVASDASLRASVHAWSKTIAADARSVSVNASRRHPRLMTASAVRFGKDALRARASIIRQHPFTATGVRAKGLALRAFTSYAVAGRRWAASGRARVRGRRGLATTLARRAPISARKGNRLLIAAGRLLS